MLLKNLHLNCIRKEEVEELMTKLKKLELENFDLKKEIEMLKNKAEAK